MRMEVSYPNQQAYSLGSCEETMTNQKTSETKPKPIKAMEREVLKNQTMSNGMEKKLQELAENQNMSSFNVRNCRVLDIVIYALMKWIMKKMSIFPVCF